MSILDLKPSSAFAKFLTEKHKNIRTRRLFSNSCVNYVKCILKDHR